LSATGPKPRSTQLHSGAWPTLATLAQPTGTAPGRALWRGRRRRHSGGGGANGGGRAPTMVRLPAGHGGGKNSSPELLVDGEGKNSTSAVAFLRRGGATMAGGGPAMVRREGKVSSTLHGRRTARGELGRRSPWTCSRRRRWLDSDGRGARTATVGIGPGDGAVGTLREGRGELGQRRGRELGHAFGQRRSERRCRSGC
jgi:hypothetical protein